MRIQSEHLEIENPGIIDGLLGYEVVDIAGALRMMHGKVYAVAAFGTFERVGDRVQYTATVWTDENGQIFHSYDSEFCDDLAMFRNGQCEYMN